MGFFSSSDVIFGGAFAMIAIGSIIGTEIVHYQGQPKLTLEEYEQAIKASGIHEMIESDMRAGLRAVLRFQTQDCGLALDPKLPLAILLTSGKDDPKIQQEVYKRMKNLYDQLSEKDKIEACRAPAKE